MLKGCHYVEFTAKSISPEFKVSERSIKSIKCGLKSTWKVEMCPHQKCYNLREDQISILQHQYGSEGRREEEEGGKGEGGGEESGVEKEGVGG